METELNNLIDKIKREGVEQAEKEAQEIITDATKEAKEIIAEAEKNKDRIIKEAEREAKGFKDSSERALKQAARDTLLSLRERIMKFFQAVIKKKISDQLSPELLKEIIIKVVEDFRKEGISQIEVLINERDRRKLEDALLASLSETAKKGLDVKASSGIEKGFRIGEKGKYSYLDFTDEAIVQDFKRYLNPKLLEILDAGLGIGQTRKDKER